MQTDTKKLHQQRMKFAMHKRKLAAFLILKHGYTTPFILEKAFGVNAKSVQNSLHKWQKSGFIQRINMQLNMQSLLMLTQKSAPIVAAELGLPVGNSASPTKIASTLIGHNLGVQLCALQVANEQNLVLYDIANYHVEPKLKSGNSRHARGDLVLGYEPYTLVECEVTRKSLYHSMRKIENIISWQIAQTKRQEAARKEKVPLPHCRFFCADEGIKNNTVLAFNRHLDEAHDFADFPPDIIRAAFSFEVKELLAR
jgi:hypothetical protein